jgi:hypothetical protein
MDVSFTIIVPRYYNSGKSIPSAYFDHLETYLAGEFGGFTKRDVGGGWLDPAGLLSHDKSYEYVIWGRIDKKKTRELAKVVKAFWEQKSVLFIIDDKPNYV